MDLHIVVKGPFVHLSVVAFSVLDMCGRPQIFFFGRKSRASFPFVLPPAGWPLCRFTRPHLGFLPSFHHRCRVVALHRSLVPICSSARMGAGDNAESLRCSFLLPDWFYGASFSSFNGVNVTLLVFSRHLSEGFFLQLDRLFLLTSVERESPSPFRPCVFQILFLFFGRIVASLFP